jgi:hypothetical protein
MLQRGLRSSFVLLSNSVEAHKDRHNHSAFRFLQFWVLLKLKFYKTLLKATFTYPKYFLNLDEHTILRFH